jgi:hypothetical protein
MVHKQFNSDAGSVPSGMNMRKKSKISLKFFVLLLLSLAMLMPIGFATSQDDVLAALNMFYESSKNKDLDEYIDIQDKLYLDEITKDSEISYRDYFRAFFEEITTDDYSIESPVVDIEEDKALVFYTLKSNVMLSSTGETKSINNDMVAFLWKYDSWKVRYTIPLTLYKLKIESETLNLAAGSLTEYGIFDQSVKQEAIQQGLISEDFLSDYDIDSENKKSGRIFSWFWLFIIATVGLLFFAFKKGIHKSIFSGRIDIKQHSKRFHSKAKEYNKHLGNKIKPLGSKAGAYTKGMYSKIKPKVIKAHNDLSAYVKKNAPIIVDKAKKKYGAVKRKITEKLDKKENAENKINKLK